MFAETPILASSFGTLFPILKRSKAAFLLNVEELGDSLYFWTFTFKEVLDLSEARKQWNLLLWHLRRKIGNLAGVRVFEMHDSHGLHVHCATTRYVRVESVRECIGDMRNSKFGRIHVKRAKRGLGKYLGKYLSKKRPEALKGWHLWAALDSKQYAHTRVADIIIESFYHDVWRACQKTFGWTGNKGFMDRKVTAFRLMQLCIAFDMQPGFWPGGEWDMKDMGFLVWVNDGIKNLRDTLVSTADCPF